MAATRNLQQLSDETRLMAEHAARTGNLPRGNRVFVALARANTGNLTPAEEQAAIEGLYRELNLLAQSIAPVTLRQLVRRHTLVGQFRHAFANVVPFAIGLLTLMLTCYLAFQSSQLHKADTALREYQEWVAEMPREKLYHAWKMFKYERVLNVQAPPLAQLDAYQKLVEDARRLAEKGEAIQRLLTESSADAYLPPVLTTIGPPGWRRFASALNGAPLGYDGYEQLSAQAPSHLLQGNGPLQFPAPAAGPIPPAALSPASGLPPDPATRPATGPGLSDCRKILDTTQPVLFKGGGSANGSDMDAYTEGIDCFLRSANIPTQFAAYSPWSTIYPIKSKINLLVVWLLPGLYGLLGACVYLMRDFVLGSGARTLAHHPTVLSMLSLSLRIALGGLAGVIIGWFWVPSGTGPTAAAPVVSSIPFGMAFLAGFSIETLFSLLDRLNRAVDTKAPQA